MAKNIPMNSEDYIVPLNMNGLRGRMLHIPSKNKKKRNILLIYGHHSSIERMFGFAEELNKYGSVAMPDLPGFGGMESFYKIGEKPTLDNLADYLAAFVKMRYKRRRVTIIGMSFGFLVATRMLQRNPELASRVDTIISIVGFSHSEDFKFSKKNYLLMRYGASLFSNRFPAWIAKNFMLKGPFIRTTYRILADNHSKLKDADRAEQQRRIDFEVHLWKCNDIRTYMDTTVSMLTVDLCNKRVDLPLYHVSVEQDRYFDNHTVEQHLSVIYKKVTIFMASMPNHAPTVIANAEDAAPFITPKMRRLLSKQV